MVVVNAIRDEERGRNRNCAEHKGAMRAHPSLANAVKTRDQQYRRSRIKQRIERGQPVIRKHPASEQLSLASTATIRQRSFVFCERAWLTTSTIEDLER